MSLLEEYSKCSHHVLTCWESSKASVFECWIKNYSSSNVTSKKTSSVSAWKIICQILVSVMLSGVGYLVLWSLKLFLFSDENVNLCAWLPFVWLSIDKSWMNSDLHQLPTFFIFRPAGSQRLLFKLSLIPNSVLLIGGR